MTTEREPHMSAEYLHKVGLGAKPIESKDTTTVSGVIENQHQPTEQVAGGERINKETNSMAQENLQNIETAINMLDVSEKERLSQILDVLQVIKNEGETTVNPQLDISGTGEEDLHGSLSFTKKLYHDDNGFNRKMNDLIKIVEEKLK